MKLIVFYTAGKKYIDLVLKKIEKVAFKKGFYLVKYEGKKEEIKGCDFAIAAGGDGTFLWASSIIYEFNLPILGINLGGLGFLTDIRKEEIERVFSELKDKNYFIQERVFLKADWKGKENVALNDVVFSSTDIRVINLDIFINDEFVTELSGDGLIVATPTGSTAYSLSAGGPILKPDTQAFVITPISPHTLTFRPLVVSGVSRILIKAKEKCRFICDGQRLFTLDLGEEVLLTRNEVPLKVIKFKDWNYFDILRKKLDWGAR
jgi:NAD+ kinase